MSLATEIQELKELWTALFPAVPTPEDSQWALWFLRYNSAIVGKGIVELAAKHRKLKGNMDADYMGKFASSVMSRLSRTSNTARQETN